MIKIHAYYSGVERELFTIFTSAIREVCSKDYSPQQIDAWAPGEYHAARWRERIEAIRPFIATIDGRVAGYADIQDDGYIDHFFVGAQDQSQGVGRALMNTLLSQDAAAKAYAQVSITAKPFFEKYGFVVVQKNTVTMHGVELHNYFMERQR